MKAAILIVVGLGLFAFYSWPREDQLDLATCSPKNAMASTSALVHGNRFWRLQLAEINKLIELTENWDARKNAVQPALDQADRTLEGINEQIDKAYHDHPSLGLPPNRTAERLRQLADKIEADDADRWMRSKMEEQLPALKRCKSIIEQRLSA